VELAIGAQQTATKGHGHTLGQWQYSGHTPGAWASEACHRQHQQVIAYPYRAIGPVITHPRLL
jgi:hypothetical protein